MTEDTTTPAIEVDNLTYVFPNSVVGLHDINISLPQHSRTLLIGANGAGKSTLLRILAGKTLAKRGTISINGVDPFRSGVPGVTYLGTEWASNPVVRHDMPVPVLLASVGGDMFSKRRDELIDILDVDLAWHMHAVSDGERRRVQLVMGLLRPWTTLLLDEVTVDLDVLVRARLLDFLHRETMTRECAIVYATHIFDGLAEWPSHIVHIHMGRVIDIGSTAAILAAFVGTPEGKSVVNLRSYNNNSALLTLALKWLKDDLADRGKREEIKKLKWEDISQDEKTGGLTAFETYFKTSRAR
ncbi:P-loop containing nucleoside triphosphate hydrolase protein [Lipomyces tetrasporus]|uniref:P-loop containing nucleoside triphosphate hydrolase protein n=1 Tax=Lipomyces tetrasporus TaxID=54092 RepID=A0AAD7VRN5_9ASCO|nr:P-loop containing nucleoside triphosphate hydrolase protein [Lipomyces tetrasporus]KAJ8099101.1 P-loop containing nucleoside triphosphate hydrolase protein [Lipomyces tetrasporus]